MGKNYSIGYGKPPRATQFQKGVSGNPRGRKKGVRNLKTDLEEELNETLPIREGNKTRRVTKQRAILKSLIVKGLHGDSKSITALLTLALKVLSAADSVAPDEGISNEDEAILARFLARVSRSDENGGGLEGQGGGP